MYEIIDFRVRPPFGHWLTSGKFYNKNNVAIIKKLGRPVPAYMEDESTDTYVKELKKAGVVMAVSPMRDPVGNPDLAKLDAQYPGFFAPFAHIRPTEASIQDCLQSIDEYVVNGVARGICMEPYLDPFMWKPDTETIFPIYEKMQELNKPILFTWGGILAPRFSLYNVDQIFTVAKTFPKLKIVLSHAGLPYVNEHVVLCMMNRNVYLSAVNFTNTQAGGPDYIAAANGPLQDNVIFESANNDPTMMVNAFINGGLNEGILPKIFYKNAARVLGIEE